MIPLCFLFFKTWVCTPKLSFYDKYWEIYMILGYSSRQLVAMAAILNKDFSSAGLFTIVLSGHPSNFPENFSFLHFFPGWHDFWANAPGLMVKKSQPVQVRNSLNADENLVNILKCVETIKTKSYWFGIKVKISQSEIATEYVLYTITRRSWNLSFDEFTMLFKCQMLIN